MFTVASMTDASMAKLHGQRLLCLAEDLFGAKRRREIVGWRGGGARERRLAGTR
jgi:hypothetical protein